MENMCLECFWILAKHLTWLITKFCYVNYIATVLEVLHMIGLKAICQIDTSMLFTMR